MMLDESPMAPRELPFRNVMTAAASCFVDEEDITEYCGKLISTADTVVGFSSLTG